MKAPIHVAVSGAAGQIAYSAIYRILSGEVFGKDQPVDLYMLEVEGALKFLEGVDMEIVDCAFPCCHSHVMTSDPLVAFKDADYVVLFGAFPRGPGMERKDLLEKNKGIFKVQGEAMEKVAKKETRVLVVGNPANTNALILKHYAPKLMPGHITAMSRLDHNRLVGQVAEKLNCRADEVKNVYVLGNHSNTMVPVVCAGTVNGKPIAEQVDEQWIKDTMTLVRGRGAKVIAARGKSSAASAANAALDHLHDWYFGTKKDEFVSVSLAAPKDNAYGVPEGLVFSFPCTCENGEWHVQTAKYCDQLKDDIKKTIDDLLNEKKMALGE